MASESIVAAPEAPEAADAKATVRAWAGRHQAKLALLAVIVAVVLVTGLNAPVFFSWQNIVNVMTQISVVGILAAGMTMLMVSGGMDLSIGSSVTLAGMVMGGLMQVDGAGPVTAIAGGVLVAVCVGLLNGTLASFTSNHPFIVTLGMMTLLQGVALLISEEPFNDLPDSFLAIGEAQVLGLPVVVLVFAAVAIAVHLTLRTTTLGQWLYAVGGSEPAATLSGIRVRAVKIAIYAINGALVGVATVLLASQLSATQPYMGQGLELTAIAAVAVGGTPLAGGRGDMLGTFMGVLLMGLIANSLILLGIPNQLQYVLQGAVIIVAVMAQRK